MTTAIESLGDAWADTTTPHGRLLTPLGGLAAFERELILPRTGAGRARAKAQGALRSPAFAHTPSTPRGHGAPRAGCRAGRAGALLRRLAINLFFTRQMQCRKRPVLLRPHDSIYEGFFHIPIVADAPHGFRAPGDPRGRPRNEPRRPRSLTLRLTPTFDSMFWDPMRAEQRGFFQLKSLGAVARGSANGAPRDRADARDRAGRGEANQAEGCARKHGRPPVTPDATKPWGGLLPAPTSAASTSWAPALAASVHTWSGIGYEVL
jgi:hypothetical protein